MPRYSDLRPPKDFEERDYELVFPDLGIRNKKRIIQKLLELRQGLDQEIIDRKTDRSILIASWNIKEFGHTKQRLPEAYFYIAEIIARFDLIVIQEIKSTLHDLSIILRLLGEDWDYMINDMTEGKDGNFERSAYIYNKKRVQFAGLAGELVLWDELTRNSTLKQLKRTPYMTGFRSGWKTFAIINLHLHPGDDGEDFQLRKEEVSLLMKAISEKVSKGHFWNENLILAGDFNFYDGEGRDDPAIEEIYSHGFREIESLKGQDTNVSFTEAYDRFFLTENQYFVVGVDESGQERGGVFNPFSYVYKMEEIDTYKSAMEDDYTGSKDTSEPGFFESYFQHPWRKNQISDHFPIWFELIIDSSDSFLKEKMVELEE